MLSIASLFVTFTASIVFALVFRSQDAKKEVARATREENAVVARTERERVAELARIAREKELKKDMVDIII